eukprot:scaffold333_cov133-Cylindrotheca_fusiformis.AAC.3
MEENHLSQARLRNISTWSKQSVINSIAINESQTAVAQGLLVPSTSPPPRIATLTDTPEYQNSTTHSDSVEDDLQLGLEKAPPSKKSIGEPCPVDGWKRYD